MQKTEETTPTKITYNAGTIKRSTRRILVTGGCGFIGSHLIDRLMQDETNHVICVDNCFSGEKNKCKSMVNSFSF